MSVALVQHDAAKGVDASKYVERAVREVLSRAANCDVPDGYQVGQTRDLRFNCRDEEHFSVVRNSLIEFYQKNGFLLKGEFDIEISGRSADVTPKETRAVITGLRDKKYITEDEHQERLSRIFDKSGHYKGTPTGVTGSIILKLSSGLSREELQERVSAMYKYAGQEYVAPEKKAVGQPKLVAVGF